VKSLLGSSSYFLSLPTVLFAVPTRAHRPPPCLLLFLFKAKRVSLELPLVVLAIVCHGHPASGFAAKKSLDKSHHDHPETVARASPLTAK